MLRSVLRRVDKVLSFIENWILFLTVFTAMITLFLNVATRYLMTYTLTWPEEYVRQVIMITTFIGCAAAVRNRMHIRIDALPNLFQKLDKPLNYLNNASVLIFSLFLIYFGFKLVNLQAMTGQVTTVLKIPTVILYSVLPLMGLLMFLRVIQVVTEDVTGKKIHE